MRSPVRDSSRNAHARANPAPVPARFERADALAGLVLAAVVGAAFAPALSNEFVLWDDQRNLIENIAFRGLGWEQIRWAFTSFHNGHYMPLVWLSWGADFLVWGGVKPFGFHLSNVVLHAVNAVLVYLLGVELLRRAAASTEGTEGRRDEGTRGVRDQGDERAALGARGAALACALVFAVHPLRVESVAWATERKDLLSGLFYLLTLLVYVRGGGRRWLAASLVYVLAVLSKVMVVSLPAVLVVLDVYPLRRLGGAAGWFGCEARRSWMRKIPFLLLAAGAAALAPFAQGRVGALTPWDVHGIGARLAVCGWGLVFYLYKTMVPVGLSPLYELRMPLDAAAPRYLGGAAIVAGTAAVLWWTRRRWPAACAAALCYVVILLPVLGLAQNGPQMTADRYGYLACIGPVLVLCGAWMKATGSRVGRIAAAAPVGLIVLALVGLTRQQCGVWRDTRSLWAQALAVDPGCIFCLNGMGRAEAELARGGQGEVREEHYEQAEARYREVLRLNPGYADAHSNLGNVLLETGRLSEALEHLAEAAGLEPENGIIRYNFGNGLAAAGETGRAIEAYQRALACPRWEPPSEVYSNLAYVLNAAGRHEEAIDAGMRAVRANPQSARAHFNLGVAQIGVGRIDAAAESFRSSVGNRPDDPAAYIEMGALLAAHGRRAPAIEILVAGRGRFPDDAALAGELNRLRP